MSLSKKIFYFFSQGNQIEIVERNILRRLPSLKHLNLKENLISHIEATGDTFTEIPQLEELYLDGNQLSHTIEDTVRPFKHLSKLRILGISGTVMILIYESKYNSGNFRKQYQEYGEHGFVGTGQS